MAILNYGYLSSSIGSSRYGSTALGTSGSSYRSSYDRSGSKDRTGYGSDFGKSGYSSGTGASPYSSRFSSTGDHNKGISSIASKFGETKLSKSRETSVTSNLSEAPQATESTKYSTSSHANTGSQNRSSSNLTSQNREPTTLYSSRQRDGEYSSSRTKESVNDSTFRTRERPIGRTRTADLPMSPTSQEPRSDYSSTRNTYTSKYVTGPTIERSGYNSGSGYGSGYGSGNYSSRYSWNRKNSYSKDNDSFRPSYSRENSGLGSDTSVSNWRSRIYGETEQPRTRTRPTTLPLQDSHESSKLEESKQLEIQAQRKRPPSIQSAVEKFSKDQQKMSQEDKKHELPSPNAVKVLPAIPTSEKRIRNKAPADFTSCSEMSENEASEESKLDDKIEQPVKMRPLRHLAAAPDLPSRREVSPSQGFVSVPSFKLSNKLKHTSHDIPKTTTSTSKWLRDDDKNSNSSPPPSKQGQANLTVYEQRQNVSSPLPPRSPTLGGSRSSTVSAETSPLPGKKDLGIANKDCRKSVLNMDVQPEVQAKFQRHQEEKREELGRLKRQRGQEESKSSSGPFNRVRSSVEDYRPLTRNKLYDQSDESSSSSEDEKNIVKPPVPPAVEKLSKGKNVERKHSKGKADSLRKSGSMKRCRERQSSQTSKTSSTSSSSESESESRSYRCRNGSFSRTRPHKTTSKEKMYDSSSPGRRSRNNSESLVKSNSKSNISKSRSGNSSRGSLTDKSNNNSKSSLLGDKKLTLGPEIDFGENDSVTKSPILGNKINANIPRQSSSISENSKSKLVNKKIAEGTTSSSSSSDLSDSESAGEEGCLFSISKSKSGIKKSKSGINKETLTSSYIENQKILSELGDRTSPDGKEQTSRPNSIVVNDDNYDNNRNNSDITTTFNFVLPKKSKENIPEDLDVSYEVQLNVSNSTEKDASSPAQIIEDAINSLNQNQVDGYDDFEWPQGSPVLQRKKVTISNDLPVEEETEIETTAEVNGHDEFTWPEGSPVLQRRKKPNYFRTQWDTETETEMEGGDWSDTSPPRSKYKMDRLPEEAEDEFTFDWPSSPELAKKRFLKVCLGDETAGETDAFDWPSSPDLPTMKDPKFISYTTDIDNLLNDGQAEDSFAELEKKLGFSPSTELKEMQEEAKEEETDNLVRKDGEPEIEKGKENLIEDEKEDSKEQEKTETDEEGKGSEDEKKDIKENKQQEKISASSQDEDESQQSELEDGKTKKQESLKSRAKRNLSLFIGKLSNIDEILGAVLQPLSATPSSVPKESTKPVEPEMEDQKTKEDEKEEDEEEEDSSIQEVHASEVKVHDAQENRAMIEENLEEIDPSAVIVKKKEAFKAEIIQAVKEGLDDVTLQIYKDGDYGTYLDLEGSLAEQADDLDGLTDSKKNAIILRTQLSVRVHAIIEKLLTSEGRELRRALFSLKQIFQDDKDLVHAFVHNDGLKCLVKVGTSADHNYQTYILRALGQVMLYVDGMTGISQNPETVRWLYSLVASKSRLVVKTALKLLLVFVEYSEFNSQILIKSINTLDRSKGYKPWGTIMRILEGKDCPDTELMIYAMTLVNKTLNGIPDQDSYYDQTDALEEQNMEMLIQKQIHNPNSDLDLLQQLTIYEAVLAYEDGDDVCRTRTIDPTIRQAPRYCSTDREDANRRKSRRHCPSPPPKGIDDITSSDDDSRGHVTVININGGLPMDDLGGIKHADAGVTPALRRRRERAERQRTFLNEQELIGETRRETQSPESIEEQNRRNAELDSTPSWMLEMLSAKKEGDVKDIASRIASLLDKENIDSNKRLPIELITDNSVKDILEKLSSGTSLSVAEKEKLARIGDVSGRIQRAKEGLLLNKIQPKLEPQPAAPPEPPKKSENDLHWENLVSHLSRPLILCDLDFTDLNEAEDNQTSNEQEGVPPPPPLPPPANPLVPPPPPVPPAENGIPPPPLTNGVPLPPPMNANIGALQQEDKLSKTKKTIKLFWREIRDDCRRRQRTVWDVIEPATVDTQKLEYFFESKAKDLAGKEKQQDQKGLKEITVLDPKRSNVINIGMTKLPPPRTIKTAILKMDSTIINREGIEKLLLTMLPTAEEKQKIQDAAIANPELPLGSAEQFLMMLASISELPARLKLWLFKLDYDNLEKEVAEPLMDIKQGLDDLKRNKTFKTILSLLLSIGNFLNGTTVKGFHLEYLSKVPEVKDTVQKHSLLHHLCHFLIEKFPDTTDLYSEVGAITRASKVDFDELQNTVEKLETDCKASWDHLKAIAKHDGPTQMKLKMSEFLADSAERIIVLGIIYKRVIRRYQEFLRWMGLSPSDITNCKPQRVCSYISEFALEYRTCRERVLQQIQKKANHRERNKTRGKMITEMEKFRTRPKSKEEEADSDLRQLLNYSEISDADTIRGKNTWRRTRESKTKSREESALMLAMDAGEDPLLDSLVKTATQAPPTRSTPRERKRSRHADRKSFPAGGTKRTRSRRAVIDPNIDLNTNTVPE